jgi:hypothetical protein
MDRSDHFVEGHQESFAPKPAWKPWPGQRNVTWHILGEHMQGGARSLESGSQNWIAEHQRMHEEQHDQGVPHKHFVPKRRY